MGFITYFQSTFRHVAQVQGDIEIKKRFFFLCLSLMLTFFLSCPTFQHMLLLFLQTSNKENVVAILVSFKKC